jgi:hypothetical protein
MRVPPHGRAALLIALVVCTVAAPAAQPSAANSETRIKAAFFAKFPQYVEWPASSLTGRSNVTLCVALPDPFGSDLDELVADETLNGRAIVIRRIVNDDDVDGCHVLFVSGRTGALRDAFMRRARALPVLTVSDDLGFLDEGGMIRLRAVGGRVRFDVAVDAVRNAGLKVSSQLLQVALTVRGTTK